MRDVAHSRSEDHHLIRGRDGCSSDNSELTQENGAPNSLSSRLPLLIFGHIRPNRFRFDSVQCEISIQPPAYIVNAGRRLVIG